MDDIVKGFQLARPNPMSSSSSSSSSAASSSAAASVEPAAAAPAPAAAGAPAGTLDIFSVPSAMSSSTDLPSTSAMSLSNFSDSTSTPTDWSTLVTSAAEGEEFPA
ncbi:hypothetical protein OGAPHI_005492 [Ogataea philodendri]|uniref:Uncharacterized protein n=1 Tax=Ogataea philodendri TaxID=1378263 RepID=A0A9P8NZC1_9ASCO|nr:uncharacterized protein OGAPHI_005492 [Ogataea philodendri]KAH3662244.1 hypothetical protein OGAPHI_005492 [Ogataea philodendri]